jgi:ubiquitin-like domain-containing CTD phosphatase 1
MEDAKCPAVSTAAETETTLECTDSSSYDGTLTTPLKMTPHTSSLDSSRCDPVCASSDGIPTAGGESSHTSLAAAITTTPPMQHDSPPPLPAAAASLAVSTTPWPTVTLRAKYGKTRVIVLEDLPAQLTLGQVKELLQEETNILPKRQKLIGLKPRDTKTIHDQLRLYELAVPTSTNKRTTAITVESTTITYQFILMGTPEADIFVDPSDRDDLPEVIDDFVYNPQDTSALEVLIRTYRARMDQCIAETTIVVMHPPRPGKHLLVLDLDHTLLDFSSRELQRDESTQGHAATVMKRPCMDDFLTQCYVYYDLVVWSQTSWRWLETKLTELGMLTHPGYQFCFVLDKTSMFPITRIHPKKNGMDVQHHVKPLQLIWHQFPQWHVHNTVHVDDLSRNFALNPSSGLQVKAFYRKKGRHRDFELLGLMTYLERLAVSGLDFERVDFAQWMVVVQGTCTLEETVRRNL